MKIAEICKRLWRKVKFSNERRSNFISIAVVGDGGVGDCIVYLNYCKHLKQYAGEGVVVDFYFKSKNIVDKLYDDREQYLRKWFNKNEIRGVEERYDLVLWMKERFPLVKYSRYHRLRDCGHSELLKLVDALNRHHDKYHFFYDCSPRTDGFAAQLSVSQGYNRFTQPDIDHILRINNLCINIPTCDIESDNLILKKFNLSGKGYLTFNRSADSNRKCWESTKLWTKERAIDFFKLMKERMPNIPIIYIGPEKEDWLPDEIINLGGETSFDELKVILKNSVLHIGPEGGMIHMRHCLCGMPSCVLFGPTSSRFYHYDENIEISSSGCLDQCEWLTETWQEKCEKTQTHTCAKLCALTAEQVFFAIEDFLIQKFVPCNTDKAVLKYSNRVVLEDSCGDDRIVQIVKNSLNEAKHASQKFCSSSDTVHALIKCIEIMSKSIQSGGKIISCGNGGSCCDAMHFAEELTGRFRQNRYPISAIAVSDPAYLTCVGNDFGYHEVFSRYIDGIGAKGDVLLAISTSGKSENVLLGVMMAKKKGMKVIALVGANDTEMTRLADVAVHTPNFDWSDRVQELHIKFIHIMIEGLEASLLSNKR